MFSGISGGGAAGGADAFREVTRDQRRDTIPAPGPGATQLDASLSLDGRRQSSSHQVCEMSSAGCFT